MTKKLDSNYFIKKCDTIHNGYYDYSLVKYEGLVKKIKIICPTHGIFEQLAGSHINGRGCEKCSYEGGRKQTLSNEEYIKRCEKIHNNLYNYDKTIYTGLRNKVVITCKLHGDFSQTANDHLSGKGCHICGGTKKLDTNTFIEKCKRLHGSKYQYNLVDYIGSKIKVKIICKKHGVFEQIPNAHLNGVGCPHCNNSRMENEVEMILKNRKIEYKLRYTFADCQYKRKLVFDFFLPDRNILIECDGIQHFEPVDKFGGVEAYRNNVIRDKIKDDYAKSNNIFLLRIKYNDIVSEKLQLLFDNDDLQYIHEHLPS